MRHPGAAPIRFAGSLGGRITLILAVGIVLAAVGALLIAQNGRRIYFDRLQNGRVIASAMDVIGRLERDPAGTLSALGNDNLIGAHMTAPGRAAGHADPDLTAQLAARVDPSLRPILAHVPSSICNAANPSMRGSTVAGFVVPFVPDCWLLGLRLGGRDIAVSMDLPRLPRPHSWISDPLYLVLIVAAAVALALVVARLATAPLRRLTDAAEAFARSIDAQPVAEVGPSDVRAALATFNLMQERVRGGVRERTRMLAAIGHDLQTPLTRLRLRLEHVEDDVLRERLVADLSATLTMVKRGLDLARSGESAEDWSLVDLDSLLSSIAEDAAEFGHPVRFQQGCGATVRVRPDALVRCLTNLVDNAVKHGGNADIAAWRTGRSVVVAVRDDGPGMTPELLTRAFDPFVRADRSSASGDGSGIGLTIARAQATAIGSTLTLANRPQGGIEALLTLQAA